MTTLVDIRELSRHFDLGRQRILRAVDNVSLTIDENEVLGLVGESGSGKSTLGKTLVGLLGKTAGTVSYRGELLSEHYREADYKRYASRIQMIFQDPYSSLNPRMTVAEIIGEGIYLRDRPNHSTAKIHEQVADWLERVGLSKDHMSRYPHEFSGGQRQRIGIARAMILSPEFVVCDEPVSALDVSVQAQVINLLQELKRTMNLTLLFIAHDLSMVHHVSDRIAVLYLGALMEVGVSSDVYFRPMHPYSSLLIQSVLQPNPEYERTRRPALMTGEIPMQVNIPVGCRFAGRCPKVMDVCTRVTPTLIPVRDETSGNVRQVACHLYDQAVDGGGSALSSGSATSPAT